MLWLYEEMHNDLMLAFHAALLREYKRRAAAQKRAEARKKRREKTKNEALSNQETPPAERK